MATVPIILGACAAAALMVLLVGLGAGEWLLSHPRLQQGMTWMTPPLTTQASARSPAAALRSRAAFSPSAG